ncbi:hypothetical protein RFH42_13585 [Acinetobacter rudis]|uniref:hypothetical protein n=1 Tax=Acinetobacter rudis TaxID=632955 RepID=UPI00280EDBCC|nr:hypothetical protein [Acinetobacter rudis]MDQ8953980.1 hypothetical protein [Acinetobacter rudis]
MIITKKFILFPLTALSLLISACSDNKAPSTTSIQTSSEVQQNTQSKTHTSTTQGNWQTKPSELSSNNKSDIQSDLTALNQIINSINTRSIELRKNIQTTTNDSTKMQETLKKVNNLHEQVKIEIMSLHLNSAEVQKIRTQIIDNLMTASQLYTLSTAADFNPAAPSKEFQQLTQRSTAIQQKVSTELNALNQQYAK